MKKQKKRSCNDRCKSVFLAGRLWEHKETKRRGFRLVYSRSQLHALKTGMVKTAEKEESKGLQA